jgi:ribonuclease R
MAYKKDKKEEEKLKPFARKKKRDSHWKKPKTIPENTLLIGVVEKEAEDMAIISSLHRKDPFPGVNLEGPNVKQLKSGDVIVYRIMEEFELIEKLGHIKDLDIYSKISLFRNNIPSQFPLLCIKQAKKGSIPSVDKHRVDLRAIPFVTIDGEDAKDFDDAVYATALDTGGWHIMVAIADVSYYVEMHTPLDEEAKKRGNSVYFANTVVPMLPEALSNELCSLKPNEDRAVLAVSMKISPKGKLLDFHFVRGLIKSKARLTYTNVQKAIDGKWTKHTEELKNEILALYGAFKALKKTSTERGTINLEMPEYKIVFDTQKKPAGVSQQPDMISHHIIEEMMILANVCAAKALLQKKQPTLFRVHDAPDSHRYYNLSSVLKALGIKAPESDGLSPHVFNEILKKVKGTKNETLIQELVLRTQSQAKYDVKNVGHFGLSLDHYCHFTSPIRRYADLIVHRCLITALKLDKAYLLPPVEEMTKIAEHISGTERIAATAEREVFERYVYTLLKGHIGEIFEGKIAGVVSAGLFVKVTQFGAEGFISVRDLNDDYYYFEEDQQRFIGRRKKNIFQLGQQILVKIVHSDPLLCSLNLSIVINNEKNKTKKTRNESMNQKYKK